VKLPTPVSFVELIEERYLPDKCRPTVICPPQQITDVVNLPALRHHLFEGMRDKLSHFNPRNIYCASRLVIILEFPRFSFVKETRYVINGVERSLRIALKRNIQLYR
jgi:hypothetical protein